jgi:YidC/Oxa1 family membrane protein insertase
MIEIVARLFAPLTSLISGALELFHSIGAPWWLSIVLLTVSVRAVLFPLTIRQANNMRSMQALKPEMDEIRSKYKDDRQKQQEALTDLYRERRVNPLAGFLPVLVQMPVFITMYQVVRSHQESIPSFANGGFLWFTDLTKADPYFILPVLSAAILLAAGEVSVSNVDPQQRRLMRLLPVMFTIFIARFPAGLFVYWVTSNAVSLIQNLLVYRRVSVRPLPQILENAEEIPAQGSVGTPLAKSIDLAKGSASSRARKANGAHRKRKKRKR